MAAIARTTVWEALQSDGWNDADLAQLAETWQSITFAQIWSAASKANSFLA